MNQDITALVAAVRARLANLGHHAEVCCDCAITRNDRFNLAALCDAVEGLVVNVRAMEALRDRWGEYAIATQAAFDHAEKTQAEVERLRVLCDRAWEVVPEGYTVLRDDLLAAAEAP